MNLHMNLPPFIFQSYFNITWIEELDAWFKNDLWLQRQWFFSRHEENNIMEKKHARHRSYSNFHPPLKNIIFTVGVKSVSKMSFLRSNGSTKNMLLTEHGKQILEFCNTSAVKRLLFFGIISAEGCQKWQNVMPTLHENQKNKLLTEHGKQISHFCNSSRLILIFLAGCARLGPVQAGLLSVLSSF